jgi:hypothetical protein
VLGLLGIEARCGEVAARAGVRLGGHVDRAHLGRTARLGVDRDRAGVREQVQHAPAGGPLAHGAAALAQVGEQTGRQRRGDVDDEGEIVFADLELDGRRRAAHELGCGLARWLTAERLEPALLVDRPGRELGLERVVQLVAQTEHRGGEQLHHEVVAVAIDRDAGQAVGLGVDQPHRLEPGQVEQLLAQRDGGAHALADQPAIDRNVRFPDEHAQRDRAVAVVQGAANELAILVDAIDRGAGLGDQRARADHLAIDPWMAGADPMRDVGG